MLEGNPRVATITLERRVRPLRLGFLLEPTDRVQLLGAVEIATATWGGRFHGLIPVIPRRTKTWAIFGSGATAAQITHAYLEAFEPDLLIEMRPGLRVGLRFPDDRIVAFADLDGLKASGLQGSGWIGVPSQVLYQDLYAQEERFVRKDARVAVLMEPTPGLELLCAALFGAFQETGRLAGLRDAFKNALSPEVLKSTPAVALKVIRELRMTPLRVGLEDFAQQGIPVSNGLVLFLMNPRLPLDVFDYWNLRALGWPIVPLPAGWVKTLATDLADFTREVIRLDPRVSPLLRGTRLIRSRSVPVARFQRVEPTLSAAGAQALTLQPWYPRVGQAAAHTWDDIARVRIASVDQSDDVLVNGRSVTFGNLGPSFLDNDVGRQGAWAMAVTIRAYHQDVPGAIPRALDRIDRLFGATSMREMWQSSEGLIVPVTSTRWPQRWELPTNNNVFASWATANGLSFSLSGAGRIGQQVMRRLDGPIGAASIARVELLSKLNALTSGPKPKKNDAAAAIRQRVGTITPDELVGLLTKLHQENTRGMSPADKEASKRRAQYWAGRMREMLLADRVLDVGLQVQCPTCDQRNWYSLDSIGRELRCEWCLEKFSFPSPRPEEAKWCYRPTGPFAIEGYAQGTLVSALALRSFALLSHAQVTWVPAFELKDANLLFEVDFGLFWQRDFLDDKPEPTLIVGESKGGEATFEPKDVTTAATVLKRIPGARFAFCTTRERLSEAEKMRIRKLASKGKKGAGQGLRNRVIVLTRRELEVVRPIPYCWEGSANYAAFQRMYQQSPIDGLAEATQALHLGLVR